MKKKLAISLVLTLVSGLQLIHAQTSRPLYTAPLGVQAYTFRFSFAKDIPKTLDTIRDMGFTEMESGSHGLPAETFRRLCQQRGIRIVSAEADFATLARNPDSTAHIVRLLGAHYLMCAWIPHKKTFTLQDAQHAAAVFNRAGKVLRDSGIIFCYHPHGYEFQPYGTGTLLDYLFSHTNPKYVSFEMDILWVQFGGGDPVALLKRYGSRWKLMHLKDLRKGTPKNLSGGTSPENDVVLGTGEIDIPGILKEAKKVGIRHFFIEDESNEVDRQVPLSIAYLKRLKD